MKRFFPSVVRTNTILAVQGANATVAMRTCYTKENTTAGQQESTEQTTEKKADEGAKTEGAGAKAGSFQSTSLSAETADSGKKRNMLIFSNTTKAVYVHPWNRLSSTYWMLTDFHKWWFFFMCIFGGSQALGRLYVARMATQSQAQLGENLLDQRTRDLLADIEKLRTRDPLRLENEANAFHELFWKRRAKHAATQRTQQRTIEMQRGLMQGEARGTDMTEWLGAKVKDDEEREVARRTHDYIQGFHQHLKAKRLI